MAFLADHASAYADIAENGAAVSFVQVMPGTLDPLTDTFSGASTVTVSGVAMRVKGDAKRYEALKLTPVEAVTLLFAGDAYASRPVLGARVSWEGRTMVVRDVDPLAPDGAGTVLARVIVVAS